MAEDLWIALSSGAVGGGAGKVAEALVGPVANEIGEDAKKAYIATRDWGFHNLKEIANQFRLIVNPDLIGKSSVRPQITLAVLQHGQRVDDPDLQQMFARLLASEMEDNAVHPSFPGIIAQMTPAEARMFHEVVHGEPILTTEYMGEATKTGWLHATTVRAWSRAFSDEHLLDISGLERLRIVHKRDYIDSREFLVGGGRDQIHKAQEDLHHNLKVIADAMGFEAAVPVPSNVIKLEPTDIGWAFARTVYFMPQWTVRS